jgi:hypothetical protein
MLYPNVATAMRGGFVTFDRWKSALAANDTFKFAKVSGDRDLIHRVWLRLKEIGADPMSRDILAVKDLELAVNGLVEKSRKLDQLEEILSDVSQSDRRTIERLSDAFYD